MHRDRAVTRVEDPAATRRSAGLKVRRAVLGCVTVAAAVGVAFAGFASSSSGKTRTNAPAHVASGIKGLYGSLPPVGTPTKGGTITIGQLQGATPDFIFPIWPAADNTAYTASFVYTMFLPLYNAPNGGTPEIDYAVSVAKPPIFSDGNKTVTINMRTNYKWANGQPVDANDVLFFVALVKQAVKESAANWSAYSPGLFPDSLASISAPSKYTIVMHLKRAFNPGYFLDDQLQGLVYPLPSTAWNIASTGGPHINFNDPANAKKIYDYLAKQGGDVATFGTDPLWKDVDGPFALTSFSATNSSYDQKANPFFGGSPKPYISQLDTETFTGITPQLNALRTGSLDIGGVDFSQLGSVGSLRAAGYSIYGYPDLGWFGAVYNFKDKTGHFNSIIAQQYIREAFEHLADQQAYLTGIFKNAGVLAYGPIPTVPPTPFTPANAVKAPYPYDPGAAVALLKSHGWHVVPNGQTTCAKAGSGANECGAGIPAGTPLKFTWFYIPVSTTPVSALESEAFASEAKEAAGIDVELQSKSFNFLVQNFDDADPSDAKYESSWGVNDSGGFTDDIYPTEDTIFNTAGDLNEGGYSFPEADKLINDSVYGTNPKDVTNEAAYLTSNPPALFMPNTDLIYAVSKKIGGPAASFLALTQYIAFPQYWYLTK
jgi:peptide/nickel transport system substrate-binding protein